MLSSKHLQVISPYGYETQVLEATEHPMDGYDVLLGFRHVSRKNLNIRVFMPYAKGSFILMDGRECVVISSITEFGIRSPVEVVSDLFQRALEVGMSDFVFHGGPPPDGDAIMSEFSRLVAASPLVLDTPRMPLERLGFSQMIRMGTPEGSPIKTDWREIQKKHCHLIDPTSTSQGHRINRIFRKVYDTDYGLSEILANNAVGLKYNPRRAFLLRTAFERHFRQVVSDKPLVANINNELSGKTGMTALMEMGTLTFEDSLVVSESFAAAMSCVVETTQTWVGHKPLETTVRIGDRVEPGQLIAVSTDKEIKVYATKISFPSVLVSVEACPTVKFKAPAWRYYLRFESTSLIRNGDKLASRHGNKGVAQVLPDDQMPVVVDPKSPSRRIFVDVVQSSLSIFKRRTMSLLWEMMLSRKAMHEGVRFELGPWEVPADIDFNALVEKGWGGKSQCFIGGVPLKHEVFAAPLYWLRLDKLARKESSVKRQSKVFLNHLGLPMNNAKLNGQRRDISKSAAMFHRMMKGLLKESILENAVDLKKFESLVKTLEPSFTISRLGS